MAHARGWIGSAALALAMLGLAQPASAVSLWSAGVGGTITANGLIFSVTSCFLKVGGVNQTDCSVINAELVVSGTTSAPILTIDGAGGGKLFASNATITGLQSNGSIGLVHESAGLNDLNVTISVSAGSRHLIDSIAGSLTGSDTGKGKTSAEMTKVSLGETVSGAPGSQNITGLTLGSLPAGTFSGTVTAYACSPQTSACTFPGVHSLNVTKDIRLDGAGVNGADVLTLSNVKQTFGVVPEPLSIGAFVIGMGGLVAARRRRSAKPA